MSRGHPPRLAVVNHRAGRVWMVGAGRSCVSPRDAGLGEVLLQDVGDQHQQIGLLARLLVRAANDEAVAHGVFGVPTVSVGARLFWGDDRLEEAARVARTPAGTED
jgi:hypothetical protein